MYMYINDFIIGPIQQIFHKFLSYGPIWGGKYLTFSKAGTQIHNSIQVKQVTVSQSKYFII